MCRSSVSQPARHRNPGIVIRVSGLRVPPRHDKCPQIAAVVAERQRGMIWEPPAPDRGSCGVAWCRVGRPDITTLNTLAFAWSELNPRPIHADREEFTGCGCPAN